MEIYKLISNLSAEDKTILDKSITIKEIKKGQLVFDEFSFDNYIYYIKEGLFRKYVNKIDGEKTLDFYFQDEIYFPTKLIENQNTNSCLQAIENSIVFKLNNNIFEKIKENNVALINLEIKILENAFIQCSERLINFQTMNATERYLHLLKNNPNIIQKISLSYIASYLGINNASLSRIRANIK